MIGTETDVDNLKGELGEIELKVTTGFTLADAIRAGAQTTSQARGKFIDSVTGDTCALGAAYIAAQAAGYIVE